MSTETTAPRGAAAPVVDLTPALVDNWAFGQSLPAVLIVNPEASLHQRCVLAWMMSQDVRAIVDGMESCQDAQDLRFVMPVLADRMRQVVVLLHSLCDATATEERGRAS